jgi:hypothetical protein
MPHMKKDLPIEFSLTVSFDAGAAPLVSRNFVMPTFPAYLNQKTYNQKCIVEFISFSSDAALTANESLCYIIFKGIKSNQFRLQKINNAGGNSIISQEFVPTPLSLIFSTHTGGFNVNEGNIGVGSDNPIVCDNLWGSQVELELREQVGIGENSTDNYKVIVGPSNCNIVMRITPFSEEKCGCM